MNFLQADKTAWQKAISIIKNLCARHPTSFQYEQCSEGGSVQLNGYIVGLVSTVLVSSVLISRVHINAV